MPLQSSGIIVVDKTPLVAATGSSSAGGTTGNSSCRPNLSQALGGGGGGGSVIGIHTQYSKQQQQQQQQFHEWSEHDSSSISQAANNSNLMRRHQRTISSSSTASSSSSQNSKALTLANHNFSQMSQINQQHQQQPHHHQQHHHTVLQTSASNHPNQVIVSEEFIEHAGFTSATNVAGTTTANVINLATNELINQTQIIKLVSDGNGGNMLIDSLGNVTNGNPHHHGNSKLLVGNLTVLSKQPNSVSSQPPQTINFVNAKNLPYLTTTKNQTQTTAVQKIVNIPLKTTTTNNLVKASTTSQLHHHHITNNSNIPNNGTPVMQKVTMPRNVQVLTRVQALAPTSPQHQQQQRQQIQQTNVLINQMIMQDKDAHNMVSAPTKMNNLGPGLKKQNIIQPMKIAQQQKLNAQCTTTTTTQAVKTFAQQQQHHQAHQFQTIGGGQATTVKQIKSQKVVRQFSNNNNNTSSAVTLTMQQQHQPRQTISAAGTYTINNGKLNNIPIQQQSSGTTKIIGGTNMKNSTTTALNANTKYLMQNHIVLPAGTNSSPTNQNLNNKLGNNNSVTNNIVVQQQIINTINNSVCGSINPGTNGGSGTIKFVNAHGAVVQSQQHQQSPTGHHPTIQQHHNQKLRNNNIHHHPHQQQTIHISPQQHHHHIQQSGSHPNTQFMDTAKAVSVDNIYLSTFVNNNTTSSGMGIANSQNSGNGDDIMIVNGTQMTDEISARILQSMSQKSVYNNTQRQQQHHQQQPTQHKIIAAPPSVTSQQQPANIILSSSIAREYPMYSPIHSVPVQQHHRQAIANAANRSQSLDRKHYESHSTQVKRAASTELFRVKGDNAPASQQAEHEDDIIGEEVRPVPVSTNDVRLQALHAVLQDHTYVAPMPTRLPLELQSGSSTGGINIGGVVSMSSGVYSSGGCIMGQSTGNSSGTIGGLQQISSPIGNIMSPGGTLSSTIGFPFGQHVHRPQHDDDANSVISNESRTGTGLDNDLGEETETAPEAEAEDDSITRCICDLTHDDGYMICCDKCSAWQHVDCMGIDRQNIPDEYLCEICQPRQVDRARARNLQLMKRKEQTQLLMNAQMNAANPAGVLMTTDSNGQLIPASQQQDRSQPLSINTNNSHPNAVTRKKGKVLAGKKKELLKKNKKERTTSKRRESKRTSKRKTKTLSSSETNQTDRYASNLRQWIENYEVAMTNHYSPELRARLHAISKQQNLLQQITATENKILKTCSNLESRCTTVPHAGGKILISNFDIHPNSPIVELRGKYMLTTQYKNQNPSINMNAPPTNCLHQSLKNQKIPGPFIFFYPLSLDGSVGPEICVDTRTYGNEARFVRRSCRPNAEIQHSFEKGTIHLYLVSLANIMASTEITIRHEPHDLLALDNKTLSFTIAPTSTMCACGLTKDCAFGGGTPIGNVKTTRKTVLNGGCLNETKIPIVKKNSQNISRGRSTSSSGESNAGLLSPNTNFTPNLYSSTSISSLMHDSGVYTSSSSPSVSIPSPTHTQAISSPPQQPQQGGQHLPILQSQEPIISTAVVPTPQTIPNNIAPAAKSPQKMVAISRKLPAKQARHSVSEESPQPCSTQTQVEDKRESRKLTREERKMEAIVKAFEKMEKNQQRKQELKQARSSSSGSNTAKRRNSSSPSPKRTKTQSVSESGGEGSSVPATVTQTDQRKNSVSTVVRKKKRKGSKSYQTQNSCQRKRLRSRINSNDSDIITSEESTSLLSPPIPPTVSNGILANVPLQQDVSENQMTLMTDLIESQIEKPAECGINQNSAGLLLAISSTEKSEDQSMIVEQSLDEREMLKSPPPTSNPSSEQSTPQTPPTVSSTCLLVEAAVGPLESLETLSSGDFKLPVKTKTKKSIMNDWLNQSNEFQQDIQQVNHLEEEVHITETHNLQKQSPVVQQPPMSPQFSPKGLETLVQAAATICDYRRTTSSPASFMATPSPDEPQNLSIMAKKVEEFIHQTDSNFICGDETVIKLESPSEQTFNTLTLPLHSSLNTSGNSSVKKRWLRQAISEETDEIAAAALSASSPTQAYGQVPNGFTTPLKKRRVIRQCNDEETGSGIPEDLSLSKSGSDTSLSNEEQTPPIVKIESIEDKNCKSELTEIKQEVENVKQEIAEVEDEVDIITSPPPSEKIVADDNLVKIEPEDVSTEIKVDVEREESCPGEPENKLEVISNIKEEDEDSEMVEVITVNTVEVKPEKETPKFIESQASTVPFDTVSTISVEVTASESENFDSVSDEIADIQKRLHSFHKENIEMLQLKNRKSKIARSLKLALSKSELESIDNKATVTVNSDKVSPKTEPKSELVKGIKKEELMRYRSSKKRHLNFDNIEKEEKEHKIKSEGRKKSQDTLPIKTEERRSIDDIPKDFKVKQDETKAKSEIEKPKNDVRCKTEVSKIDDKQLQAALTIPNFNHNVMSSNSAPNPISSYVLNVSALPNTNFDISSLLLAPPPPPPPTPPPTSVQGILPVCHSLNNVSTSITGQPSALHLPYYNTIYGKLLDKSGNPTTMSLGTSPSITSSNLLLSDYLDTKAKSYSSLGGYVSHSALFGLNNSKISAVTLSNSTCASATSSSLDTTLTSSLQSSTKPSKILTKTASSDPRLNPILSAPEPPPAPKRKLSINEYRKRKQQSTEGSNTPSPSDCESKSMANITSSTTKLSSTSFENVENGTGKPNREQDETDKIGDTEKVQFSPAPTLLEQQQETLCERLKSLKNKTSSAVMSSLGVSPLSGIATGTLSSPDGLSSLSSSASNLSSSADINCLNKIQTLTDNFEASKRHSLSTSSLESISSSPSPISSKESTPERAITTPPLPRNEARTEVNFCSNLYSKHCRESTASEKHDKQKSDVKVSR